MTKKLFIVESPGKINKLGSILGNEYIVAASVGHVQDLVKKDLGIDVNNNFKMTYQVSTDKKKVVSNLKSLMKSCNEVILAADEDREGEAIAASLADVLKLKDPKRVVFNEITKSALTNALKNPRKINYNLVRAQETRRALDRLVGWKLSPLLWQNVAPKLSAGRVQSVVVKLIIDKENEIEGLNQKSYFKLYGKFHSKDNKENVLSVTLYELDKNKTTKTSIKGDILKLNKKKDVEKLLNVLNESTYSINLIEDKISKRNPSPPFITSTLQQEASKKFSFNIKSTMSIAQKLYERGYITYMRTDSTSLSNEALKSAGDYIINNFGKEYHNKKQYVSKSKNAQEAHEAIRPTKLNKPDIEGPTEQKKLYSLIWKRTIASQMSAAKISVNNIYIEIIHNKVIPYYFLATNENIIFEGFLKVYNIKSDDDEELQKANTNFKKGDKLNYDEIEAKEEYPKSIGRYNEANLVKKLEDLGIGRPSTYASIINKIQERNYIEKVNLDGEEKKTNNAKMKPNKGIKWTENKTTLGKEKQKLIPTSIGKLVNEYLCNNFDNVMDYKFTANLENNLDKIVDGKKMWTGVLQDFWDDFSPKIENLSQNKIKLNTGRLLGEHPDNGCEMYATIARYGPVVKLIDGENIKYAGIDKPLNIDNITLEQAIKLFEYPKTIGLYNSKEVTVNKGKYGVYVKYNDKSYPLKKETNNLEEIIKIIKDKNKDIIKEIKIKNKSYQIRNGQYGPYISYKAGTKVKFKKIPQNKKPENLTEDDILKLTK